MKAVLFDAFGTLVEIMDKRNPFVRALAKPKSENLPFATGRSAMLFPIQLDYYTDDPELHADLAAELLSIKVYPDVIPTLHRLRGEGIKVGIISNLAAPYAEVLIKLLAEHVDAMLLSCYEGHLKPNPEFFELALKRLGVEASQTTMVGDNYKNDFLAAERCGLNAVMIVRPNDTLDDLL